MNPELQKKLFDAAPVLFGARGRQWNIELPDDLFPFISELVARIENFNQRYRKRYVRALKISMADGKLEFLLHRQVKSLNQAISATYTKIRLHRKQLKTDLLNRAKAIQCTALFVLRLLPDWKNLMPDGKRTLCEILRYAERYAQTPADWSEFETGQSLVCRGCDSGFQCG